MDDITKINNNANLSRYLDRIQDTPYKPAHKKMLTDLINYAVDHDWTLRTLADAKTYLDLADGIMGPGWATAKTFRFGASGLYGVLADIIAGTAPAERTDGAY